jgi:signal peptidase
VKLNSSESGRWSLKSSYVKTILLAAIILGSVVAFWFGVRAVYRTDYPLLTVASGSMIPTLNIGDLIVVQGVLNVSDLKAAPRPEGDIIVFRNPSDKNELIVHRAINKTMHDGFWYIRTKGDANPAPDPWTGPDPLDTWNYMVSEKLLIGKVVGRIPWLGYIPLYIRTPTGIVLLIALILIIIFAEYIPVSPKKQETAKD